jgi:hypothetical protein
MAPAQLGEQRRSFAYGNTTSRTTHRSAHSKGRPIVIADSDREELIIGRRYDMRDYVRLILPPMLTIP